MQVLPVSTSRAFVSARDDGGSSVVWVIGDFDDFTVDEIENELNHIVPQSPGVVIDLSGCSFISVAALRVLERLGSRLPPGRAAIVSGDPHVVKLLRIAGLEFVFRRHGSLVEALEALYRMAGETQGASSNGGATVSRLPTAVRARELQLLEGA